MRSREDVKQKHADIAVLAIPAEDAQDVVDRIVAAGIRAILNFAPAQMHVPPHVVAQVGEHGDGARRAVVRAHEPRSADAGVRALSAAVA